MVLYDYHCKDCGKTYEKYFLIEDCPNQITCKCGGKAAKIISAGHGGVQTDNDVSWLPSAVKVLQPDWERPIATRTEYKKYLKDTGTICKG